MSEHLGRRLLGRARDAVPGRAVGSAVAAVPVARPHAVLGDEALRRAVADLATVRAGGAVEQGHVPDAVAWSLARRTADPPASPSGLTSRRVDGVVDLVDPDRHDRLLGALLVHLSRREQVRRSAGGSLVALAAALTDAHSSTVEEERLYLALLAPDGRLVSWRWSDLVPGQNLQELHDASGALLLVQTRAREPFDWDWADGTPGPWTPMSGTPGTRDPDVRVRRGGPPLTRSRRLPEQDGASWWTCTLLPQVPPARRLGVQALRLLPHLGSLTCGL